MAAVQQRVLNWLYSVLTSEYRDVNRTYNDVAQTLSHYSSLAPRTDVYTYENGASALLLHISGTLPVTFRGTTYRFPIALWIPHAYPHEAPLVYVTPVEGMMVRAGQHVDPQGKVYHPYLVGWAEYWDKSNILDFLAILRDVFAKEPPVISRQPPNAPPRLQSAAIPPPIPPLPPNVARPTPSPASPRLAIDDRPPPPPPKPTSNAAPYSSAIPPRHENGPPLPPLPPQVGYNNSRYGPSIPQSPNGRTHTPQISSSLRYETAPPLPPQPSRQNLQEPSHSPVSPITPPEEPYGRSYPQSYQQFQQPPPPQPPNMPANIQQPIPQNVRPPQITPQLPPQYMQPQQQQQQYPHQGPPQTWAQYQQPPPHAAAPPPPQSKPPPPPDLLDAPLTLAIPSASSANLPAPPVPPNPEKDMLLHKLASALHSQRQHTTSQNTSTIPSLQSQHASMLNTLSSMQSEVAALESLSALLTNDTSILHSSLQSADQLLSSSQHRTPPSIDELLVAPTVVGNQLYELVCEERSLGDAIFILGRAVERGRISAPTFAKMTRGLAREWFLKKALVKKIGRGMGLTSY
ncbi:ESCRT-I component protein [Rutstroemia sp. NJR-2017a WRK4]|nr:ESCRT-I component protein [Rutstroemia sp. NJR-2017a WRK4]